VLEIERFEWTAPDRIEIAGTWSGLRGHRFIRPTLALKGGEDEPKRLLALLEHKPWPADDGADWIAAFPWEGPIVKFGSAELSLGTGFDLTLPPPRMRPGKPRRFRQRVAARDAARDIAPDAPRADGPGVVTEPAPKAPKPKPANPKPKPAKAPPAPNLAPDLERVRGERDDALERARVLRGELEAERHSRERAVADARALERDAATRMLAEGGELRASVERQREMAFAARDEAIQVREAAIEAHQKAEAERAEAVRARKLADRERDKALAERDRATKDRDRAIETREQALRERDRSRDERDLSLQERDMVVSLQERGLPIKQPRSRFMPERHAPGSDLEVWMPRIVAVGVLFLFALVLQHLFSAV
jgi:hypothetical protein